MYNGIGLTTARGSATSGHVTKNLTYIKPEFFRNKLSQNQGQGRPHQDEKTKALAHKKGNQDILEHNEKRSIEAKIFEFQEKLLELKSEIVLSWPTLDGNLSRPTQNLSMM